MKIIKRIPIKILVEPIEIGIQYPKLILEIEIKSPSEFIILESNANIIFKKERGNKHLEIHCKPYENNISSSTRYFKFYTFLTPELLQSIETFRAGENLKVNLNIHKLYLLKYITKGYFTPVQENSRTEVLKGEISTDNIFIVQRPIYAHDQDFLLITREQWGENVLELYNLNNRFILEIPFKFPNITIENTTEVELNELKNRILRGIDLLRKTIKKYNISKDVDKCINNIREITDLLHNITNRDALYEIYGKYLIEKSITGSENISKDLIEKIFNIIDSLFYISSKGPHSTTRRGEPMEYQPKYEDGDTLLGITTFIYYFLSKKFERLFSL